MKVIIVEPMKAPYAHEIGSGLKSMQSVVEGLIEPYYFTDDPVVIVCNEEGKIDSLPLNRAVYSDEGELLDIIAGTFFVVGLPMQMDMFGEHERRAHLETLDKAIDGLRDRYGHNVIRRGATMTDMEFASMNPRDEHMAPAAPFYGLTG